MKKITIFHIRILPVALMLSMTLTLLAVAASASMPDVTEVIINVVDGRCLFLDYDWELEDIPKPIQLGYIHGIATVRVFTVDGIEIIELGDSQLALTQNSAPYATELDYDLADIPDTYAVCPVCERSTKIGNHSQLPCGHWGCLQPADHLQVCVHCKKYLCNGKDHSVCAHCGVPWCVHVDIECPWTRNPAPTPYKTIGPDGKPADFSIDTSSRQEGGYEGYLGAKGLGWNPGMTGILPLPEPDTGDGVTGGMPGGGMQQGSGTQIGGGP